ncbi:MAG: corrinoid protein [Burkholderiales bacterium]|nr:corrinoid protein [Burkholderiales bacterium]
MTRVTFAEYYRRWSPRLTLYGGIPSTVVLPETSDADFEAYLDGFFRAVAPGNRLVVGVADEVPPKAIFSRLQRIGERIAREGALPLKAGAARTLEPALARPGAAAAAAPAGDAAGNAADDVYAQVRQDVFKGRHLDIKAHVQALLDQGVRAGDILEHGLIAAITVVGNRMATGDVFIPEVLLAARAMTAAVKLLEPHIAASGEQLRGRVLVGTVRGDMHDIGKNLVVTMLRGVGFEVRDLGVSVSRDRFCEEVAAFEPDVLGLSALLTTTMVEMGEIIKALDASGLRRRCRVIVGGAPVSEQFAAKIGADGYGANAVEAVRLTKRMVAEGGAARH